MQLVYRACISAVTLRILFVVIGCANVCVCVIVSVPCSSVLQSKHQASRSQMLLTSRDPVYRMSIECSGIVSISGDGSRLTHSSITAAKLQHAVIQQPATTVHSDGSSFNTLRRALQQQYCAT
jgi:hypothetical protein